MNNATEITTHDLFAELERGSQWRPYNSHHEALAVLWEEFEELKVEIFKKEQDRSISRMYQESLQVAAVAFSFAVQLREHREMP